jgi:hypothetical protein
LLVTASISNATTTFTKGDGSQFSITANNVVNATSASFATSAVTATSSSFATNANTATSASFATFAATATSASFATSAASATSASFATTAATASYYNEADTLQTVTTRGNSTSTNISASGFYTTGTITTQNAVVLGTASIAFLDVTYQSSSVIYSSGSNQFGDASNDVQTLFGTVDVKTGPLKVTGSISTSGSITMVNGADLTTHHIKAPAVNGVEIQNNSSGVVALFGAGGSLGTTFYGQINGTTFVGTASLATTASYALNAATASVALSLSGSVENAVSSSYPFKKGDGANSVVSAFYPTSNAANDFDLVLGGSGSKINSGRFVNTIVGGMGSTITGTAGYASGIFSSYESTISAGGLGTTIIGGANNTFNESNVWGGIMLGGYQNTHGSNNGYTFMLSGQSNTITTGASRWGGIVGGQSNQLDNAPWSVIVGGSNHSITNDGNVQNGRSVIVGGRYHTINPGINSAIIGGSNNIIGAVTGSVILGGTNITASVSNTVYVPNLVITGSLTASNATTFVQNTTDTYTSSAAIQQIVTLTQAEYNAISGSANANTFYVISDSTGFNSGIFATTGSNTFVGNQVITGSLRGEVRALSISSNTASMDCSLDNFFTLTLVSGSNTFINPSNIAAGQTINLRVTQANPGNGTVSFPTSVKQVSGSSYVPSVGAGPVDIVTFISFDASSLYLSNVKNLV